MVRRRVARVGLTMLVAIAGLGSGIAPAAASPAWSPADAAPPVGPVGSSLSSVTCPTAQACFAIGVDQTYIPEFVAQRWNGATWQSVPIQTPAGFTGNGPSDLACPSRAICFAVGSTGSPYKTPLMERWNGTSWSIITAPKAPKGTDAWLTDVSCPTATFCLAIGNYNDQSSIAPFAARWNGAGWSAVSIPRPKFTYRTLDALSCTSRSNCFAVGRYMSEDRTFVERWNGTSWSVVKSPAPAGSHEPRLLDVSCPTTTMCVAVGAHTLSNGTPHAFAERWDGAKWSLLTTHAPAGSRSAVLGRVSCASRVDCFAVGYVEGSAQGGSWIQHFDGAKWNAVGHQRVTSGGFAGVFCVARSMCLAVGGYGISTPYNNLTMFDSFGLIERWNGTTWSIAAPPATGSQSELDDVSCSSATFCVAVGAAANLDRHALVEHWNGTTWTVFPLPDIAGAIDSVLEGISCSSSTSCLAVGSYSTAKSAAAYTTLTLVERWDGTRWSIVTGATGVAGSLHAVSCPSTRCFATGRVIAQVDGPSVTMTTNNLGEDLNRVSCTSDTSCFAVGRLNNSPLIRRWNGASWSKVPHPSPPPPSASLSYFTGVSCVADGTCFAVAYSDRQGGLAPLVERWNGSAWTITPTPALGRVGLVLDAVTCATSTSCVAVGGRGGHEPQTLVEQWNGSTWEIVASPNRTGMTSNGLNGVSCAGGPCFAVGASRSNQHTFPLVEQYG
jgi:hypothetical protein